MNCEQAKPTRTCDAAKSETLCQGMFGGRLFFAAALLLTISAALSLSAILLNPRYCMPYLPNFFWRTFYSVLAWMLFSFASQGREGGSIRPVLKTLGVVMRIKQVVYFIYAGLLVIAVAVFIFTPKMSTDSFWAKFGFEGYKMFMPGHGLAETDSSINTLQAVYFAVKAGVIIALGIFLYGGICSSVKALNMPSDATVTGGSAVKATLPAALFAVGAYYCLTGLVNLGSYASGMMYDTYELLRSTMAAGFINLLSSALFGAGLVLLGLSLRQARGKR